MGTTLLSTLFDFSSIPIFVSIIVQQKQGVHDPSIAPPLVSIAVESQQALASDASLISSTNFQCFHGPASFQWGKDQSVGKGDRDAFSLRSFDS